MAVALIVILIIFLCWPTIMKWVSRFMARRAEDYLRKATGMPPRPGSREARRQARAAGSGYANGQTNAHDPYGRSSYYGRGSRKSRQYDDGPIIPREYAEDVEFVETVDYSETTIASESSSANMRAYHESQVSDVEWEEVKVKENSRKSR